MAADRELLRWALEEQGGSAEDEDDAGDLRTFDDSVEARAATDWIAPEFSDVHDDAGGT